MEPHYHFGPSNLLELDAERGVGLEPMKSTPKREAKIQNTLQGNLSSYAK